MQNKWHWIVDGFKIIVGCALFGLGFSVFLAPSGLSAGGVSGIGMIFVEIFKVGTVGGFVAAINIPLFILAAFLLGKKFFIGSFVGMAFLSTFIDLFAMIPPVELDPLLCALYGGAFAGAGLGIVFVVGASTGGSDIIVRILKRRWQNIPIGWISIFMDMVVAVATGIVFHNLACALYSGVAIFVTGKVIDVVVYSFDYSKVALIISEHHQQVADRIATQLDRGATFLKGEGSFTGEEKMVVLTAVKRQQLAELKSLVSEIDPKAFVIVQEAHQVLGDGFSHYSKDSL